MRQLTACGYVIAWTSSELPEIIGTCDRVAVFVQGRIVQALEASAISPEEIVRHATAGDAHELA